MQQPDQSESTTESNEKVDEASLDKPQAVPTIKAASLSATPRQLSSFDWNALAVVILIAAFFALAARLNAQPATSFVPVAVLSATGCGLLATAIRKLRTPKGAGLLVAALGGFFMAIFQFTVAITYPGVFDTISQGQTLGEGFLITWGLITGFSILFSIAGASLGHLAFAPLRTVPVPAKSFQIATLEDDEEGDNTLSSFEENPIGQVVIDEEAAGIITSSDGENVSIENSEQQKTSIEDTEDRSEAHSTRQPPRTVFSYFVTVLLLGLAPTIVGYVFSAAYDYILGLNQFIPGPYPTLRLLSTMLPWQVPLPIDLHGSIGKSITYSLLWRIPLFLGNPTLFDLQALEPYVFNGAALGLLLLSIHRGEISPANQGSSVHWPAYLLLEAMLGLFLVLPANIWVLRGLEGLLQLHEIVVPIRTLSILNPLTFSLNLISGPLVCLALGIILKRAYTERR